MYCRMLSVAVLLISTIAVSAVSRGADDAMPSTSPTTSTTAKKILALDAPTQALLAKANDLLEIAPVVLPEGDTLLGNNDHFGWPVATMARRAIIVVFYRIPQHWGDKAPRDKFTSNAVVVRSTDGGHTWSKPLSLGDLVETQTPGCRRGFGNSIGTTTDGTVVVGTSYGVFRSSDEGVTWQHLPGAFGEGQLKGPRTNHGPRLIEHPEYGLLCAGHDASQKRRNPDHTPYIPPELWLRYSRDGGRTWQEQMQQLPDFATPIEPTLLTFDGRLLVLARCHGAASFEPERKTWRYVQLFSRNGRRPLTPQLTNIRCSDTRDIGGGAYHGPWTQDTTSLCINPMSGRIEAVVTNRNGGGPGHELDRDSQTLNLWSIAPAELDEGSATWRFKGTLLRRHGICAKATADGMHPGGAVIDAKRGVQHIFIYAGMPTGPAGIFRVTRTLKTGELHQLLTAGAK